MKRGKTRELRWCSTCRELVSRDRNACENIRRIHVEEERPKYLSDTYSRKEREGKILRGCNRLTQRITEDEEKIILKTDEFLILE